MRSENYSFYPPKNPQFFFPKKEFKNHKKYYTPFSLKSKLVVAIFYTILLAQTIKRRQVL